MPVIRVGVELASLHLPIRAALQQVSRWGSDAVVLDARGELAPGQLSETGARHLRKLLDDLNLRVSAISFRTRRGYDDLEELDARVAATRSAMQMAYALRAPLVINHIGRIPAGPDAEAWPMLLEVLQDLGNFGHRIGSQLAAETGSQSGDDLARLLSALPEATLAVDLNPGNLLLGGFSPEQVVQSVGHAIRHVHASDAVRDPSGHQAEFVTLGRGEVDYPALLAALYERGYQGDYTIQHRTSSDPLADIPRAMRYLRAL